MLCTIKNTAGAGSRLTKPSRVKIVVVAAEAAATVVAAVAAAVTAAVVAVAVVAAVIVAVVIDIEKAGSRKARIFLETDRIT